MADMTMNTKNNDNSFRGIEQSQNGEDWEKWDRLKLSSYHGRKLVKRNFQPYRSNGERFQIHEIDKFGLNTETKIFIIMQTFKRLFGNVATASTSKGRKYANKLTFLREKGRRYFLEGKKIEDLIELPQAYWDALEALKNAQEVKAIENSSKKAQEEKVSKRPVELTEEKIEESRRQQKEDSPQKKRLRSDKNKS